MDVDDRLASARVAHQRQDWQTTYDALAPVAADLGTDDLRLLADAEWWLGRIREYLELSDACFDRLVSEGRDDVAAAVALEVAVSWFIRGQAELGSGWQSRARRLLNELPESLTHGYLLWLDSDGPRPGEGASRLLNNAHQLRDMGRRLGEPALSSFGLFLEGRLTVRDGDLERGFGLLDEAMLPVLAGRVAPEHAGELYCLMMSLCSEVAAFGRAQYWKDATERWFADLGGAAMFAGICRVHRTQLTRMRGDWPAAAAEAAQAARDLTDLNVAAAAEAHYEVGEAHRLRGDEARARSAYDEAVHCGHTGQPGRALLDLACGRGQQASAALGPVLAETDDPWARARLLAARTEVACHLHDPTAARSAADELSATATRFPTEGMQLWAALARGTADLCSEAAGPACDHLRAALELAQRTGAAYDAATARALLGRALTLKGDDDAGQGQLAAARATYTELGAAPALAWLDQWIAPAPPGGLTPREAEVLTAIAEGLSNKQVAARLVISEKTVARHLANVYRKLDVGSRTAAAAWAHQQGLAR